MDKETLLEALQATFVAELDEHLKVLQERLLTLESEPPADDRHRLAKEMFRAAHSLKGAARAVEQTAIAGACHALEDLLSAVRDERIVLHSSDFQLLFALLDRLTAAGMQVRAREPIEESDFTDFVTALRAASSGRTYVAPKAASAPVSTPQGGTTRIHTERLDGLLDTGGELLLARNRLGRHRTALESAKMLARHIATGLEGMQSRLPYLPEPSRRVLELLHTYHTEARSLERALDRVEAGFRRDLHQLDAVADPLEKKIRRLRMVPFSRFRSALERTVRDIATAQGKRVTLTMSGGDVEFDRAVLDGIKDALFHLVRNAVVHGAESVSVRQSAGKPDVNHVEVSAALRGSNVEIAVADDGMGLDREAIRVQAEAMGLSSEPEGLEDRVIFKPRLSTASEVTQHSGRGVGLDVVLSQVEALHGTIDVTSQPGRGSRFAITVPLTLTRFRVLRVRCGMASYCFASSSVVRLLRIPRHKIRQVHGRSTVTVEDEVVLAMPLAHALGGREASFEGAETVSVIVAMAGDRRVAFIVDELVSEEEVVVKNLGRRLCRVRHVAGATILPAGGLALILNVAELIRSAVADEPWQDDAPQEEAPQRARILLVDDTATTRSLVKTMLEGAGYEVHVAHDGLEAWGLIQRERVDVVVADVEMPHMDGFMLTETVRSSRFRDVPIILLTGRARAEDRARGMDVGANAYLVKQGFDQSDLLATIAQLV